MKRTFSIGNRFTTNSGNGLGSSSSGNDEVIGIGGKPVSANTQASSTTSNDNSQVIGIGGKPLADNESDSKVQPGSQQPLEKVSQIESTSKTTFLAEQIKHSTVVEESEGKIKISTENSTGAKFDHEIDKSIFNSIAVDAGGRTGNSLASRQGVGFGKAFQKNGVKDAAEQTIIIEGILSHADDKFNNLNVADFHTGEENIVKNNANKLIQGVLKSLKGKSDLTDEQIIHAAAQELGVDREVIEGSSIIHTIRDKFEGSVFQKTSSAESPKNQTQNNNSQNEPNEIAKSSVSIKPKRPVVPLSRTAVSSFGGAQALRGLKASLASNTKPQTTSRNYSVPMGIRKSSASSQNSSTLPDLPQSIPAPHPLPNKPIPSSSPSSSGSTVTTNEQSTAIPEPVIDPTQALINTLPQELAVNIRGITNHALKVAESGQAGSVAAAISAALVAQNLQASSLDQEVLTQVVTTLSSEISHTIEVKVAALKQKRDNGETLSEDELRVLTQELEARMLVEQEAAEAVASMTAQNVTEVAVADMVAKEAINITAAGVMAAGAGGLQGLENEDGSKQQVELDPQPLNQNDYAGNINSNLQRPQVDSIEQELDILKAKMQQGNQLQNSKISSNNFLSTPENSSNDAESSQTPEPQTHYDGDGKLVADGEQDEDTNNDQNLANAEEEIGAKDADPLEVSQLDQDKYLQDAKQEIADDSINNVDPTSLRNIAEPEGVKFDPNFVKNYPQYRKQAIKESQLASQAPQGPSSPLRFVPVGGVNKNADGIQNQINLPGPGGRIGGLRMNELGDKDIESLTDQAGNLDEKSNEQLFDANIEKDTEKSLEKIDDAKQSMSAASNARQLAKAKLKAEMRKKLIKQLVKMAAPWVGGALLTALFFGSFIALSTVLMCAIVKFPPIPLEALGVPREFITACGGDAGGGNSCPPGYIGYRKNADGTWVVATGNPASTTSAGLSNLGTKTGALSAEQCAMVKKLLPFLEESARTYSTPEFPITVDLLVGKAWLETRVGTGGEKAGSGGECAIYGDGGFGHGLFQIDPTSGLLPGTGRYQAPGIATNVKDPAGKSLVWSDCRDNAMLAGYLLKQNYDTIGKDLKKRVADSGLKEGSVEFNNEFYRQMINSFNAGIGGVFRCTIGTDDCTTQQDAGSVRGYGLVAMGIAADARDCLSGRVANAEVKPGLALATVTNAIGQFFQPIRVEAQAAEADQVIRDRVAGYYDSGEFYQVKPEQTSTRNGIKNGNFDINIVKLLDNLYRSGFAVVTGPYDWGRDYGDHGSNPSKAIDIWGLGNLSEVKGTPIKGLKLGPQEPNVQGLAGGEPDSPSLNGNIPDQRIRRHVDIPSDSVAAELYFKVVQIAKQSGTVRYTLANPAFLDKYPGIVNEVNYAHEHHLHISVISSNEATYKYSDGVSAPTTSGSGGSPQICCPPGVTPGTVSNTSSSGGKLSQKVFDFVAKLEGGLVDNPNDTGGRTNGGVTQKTYDAYRKAKGLPTQAVDNLSAAEKREIYDQFYAVSKADRLKAPLSMAAFDTAINFGEAAMGTFLREILQNKPVNSIPDSELKILTDAEVEQLNSRDPKQVAIELLNRRLQFRDIRVQQDPSQRVFLAGWRARDNEVLAQIQSGAFDTASSTLLLPQEYAVNDDSKKNLPQNIFESIFTPIRAEALISGPAKDSGNEFSQLSKSHLEFMEWVAKEKKYPGPYADNGGPDPATKTAADKLIAQAKADGINLQIAGIAGNYGYRGYNAQTFLFLDKIPSNLRYQDSMGAPDQVPQNVKNAYLQRASLSAPVGYSEHHTGKAVDFISDDGVSANLDPNTYPTALANWLETNATKAGFKLSYPKNSTAGAGYEPWHWLFGSVTPSDPNSETGANVSVPGGCIVAGTSGVSAGTNGSTTGGLPSNGKGTLNSGIYDTDFLKKLADGILTRNTITGNDCYAIVAGNGSILEGLDPDMILQGLATSPFTKSAYMFHDFMQSSSEGVPNYVRYGYEYSNDTAKMQRGSIVVISGEINKERGGDGDINVFIGKEEMASRGYGGYDAWMGRPINDEAISDLILGIYTKIKK